MADTPTPATDRVAGLLGGLDRAMFLVTVAVAGERSGCLVGFTTQASIDPVRFLVCLSTANHTHALADRADHLVVHGAPADDEALVRLFGEETGDEVDKFTRCRWHEGPYGQPILEGVPAWFVGRIRSRHPFGDHEGFLLDPVAASGEELDGVLGLQDALDLDPGHPA